MRQFCRKLLGYALGRAVQLSDEPLLAEMQSELAANDYKVDVAVETHRAEPAVPRDSRRRWSNERIDSHQSRRDPAPLTRLSASRGN